MSGVAQSELVAQDHPCGQGEHQPLRPGVLPGHNAEQSGRDHQQVDDMDRGRDPVAATAHDVVQVAAIGRKRAAAQTQSAEEQGEGIHAGNDQQPGDRDRVNRSALVAADRHRQPGDRIAQHRAAGVAEKSARVAATGRAQVMHQKAEHGQRQHQRNEHQAGSRAAQPGGEREQQQHDQRHSAGQAIETVGHVDGVDHEHHAGDREYLAKRAQPDHAPGRTEQLAEDLDLDSTAVNHQRGNADLDQQPGRSLHFNHVIDQPGDHQHQHANDQTPVREPGHVNQ